MIKPLFVTNEHLEYLDSLRESGVTNMYAAIPYLQKEFPYLSNAQAGLCLSYWMKTFTERHSK